MRTFFCISFSLLMVSGALSAGVIGGIPLSGTSDLVAFNGNLDTITMGSQSCTVPNTGTCTYGGSQALGSGALTWEFLTPNTTGNITYDQLGDLFGPTGGTFSASDGSDSIEGTYIFSSWEYDIEIVGVGIEAFQPGIDLNGTISVTGETLNGGSDPNEGAFESLFDLPAANSYTFTLDVGNCTSGASNKSVQCIIPTDPSAYFKSLDLIPETTTPEPGTLGTVAAALLAVFAIRRRTKNITAN